MMPKYFSEMWPALASALGDHLWQSSLIAVAAGLIALVLRKNQARARYWLWLAASMKFLIPFSLLVGVGSRLTWLRSGTGEDGRLYAAVNEVSQAFTRPPGAVCSAVLPLAPSPSLSHFLPAFLAAMWLCGFVVVLAAWYVRWRKISAAMCDAVPLPAGREVEALRRMERAGGVKRRIKMMLSSASLEPGIFGIARPVLLWPKGISEHLGDAHLEAIVAHEVWHVRRRDNLAAAMHMVVEATFWFHPLVWWLGARLVEERERACDEAVLELGSERHVYAESILKTCEFCMRSPLACAPGVTGADLRKRVAHIMTPRVIRKLNFSTKLLLAAAAVVVVAVPLAVGLLRSTPPQAGAQAANPVNGAQGSAAPYANQPQPATTVAPRETARSPKVKACSKSKRLPRVSPF